MCAIQYANLRQWKMNFFLQHRRISRYVLNAEQCVVVNLSTAITMVAVGRKGVAAERRNVGKEKESASYRLSRGESGRGGNRQKLRRNRIHAREQ